MTHPIHFGRIWPTTTARPVSMPSRANPTRMGRKKSFSSKFSVWADAIVRWLWSCARTVSKPTDVQEAHAAEDSPGECPVCQPAITGPHLPGQCHREEHEEQHGHPPDQVEREVRRTVAPVPGDDLRACGVTAW